MIDGDRWAEFERALPWYVNGTIDAEGRHRVEEVLRESPQAAQALDWHREMQQVVRTHGATLGASSGWSEDEESSIVRLLDPEPTTTRRGLAEVVRSVSQWRLGSRPTMGLTAALVVMVGVGFFAQRLPDAGPAAGDNAVERSAVAMAPLLELRFKRGVTEWDTRKLLLSVDAHIVEGPSQLGDYSLSVPPARLDVVRLALEHSPLVEMVSVQARRGCCAP